MSFDRYEVDIADSIATLDGHDVVNQCSFQRALRKRVPRCRRQLTRVLLPVSEPRPATGRHRLRDRLQPGRRLAVEPERVVQRAHARRKLQSRTNTVTGGVPDELAGSRRRRDRISGAHGQRHGVLSVRTVVHTGPGALCRLEVGSTELGSRASTSTTTRSSPRPGPTSWWATAARGRAAPRGG